MRKFKRSGRNEIAWANRLDSESLARLLRKILRANNRPLLNHQDIIFELPKLVPQLKIRVVSEAALPRGVEAKAFPKKYLIKIRKGVSDGLERGDYSARWTYVHEYAHVLLGHAKNPHRTINSSASAPEREANLLAAELLAPKHLARGMTVNEMRSAFQISHKAAEILYTDLQQEQQREKATHPIVRRRHEELAAKISYLEKLEDTAATVFHAIFATHNGHMKNFCPKALSYSVVIAVAAQLLFDAYRTFGRQGVYRETTWAATVAVAILLFCPVQMHSVVERSTANLKCAIRAAASMLGLTVGDRVNSAAPKFGFSDDIENMKHGYLKKFLDVAEKLVSDHVRIPNFDAFPIYEIYNELNDLTWEEIHALEKFTEFLSLIDSTYDT